MSEENLEQDMTAEELKAKMDGEEIEANVETSTEETQPEPPPATGVDPKEVKVGDHVYFADQHGNLSPGLVRHVHGPTLVNLVIIAQDEIGADTLGKMVINHTSVPKGVPSDTEQGVPAFYWCWGWEVPNR